MTAVMAVVVTLPFLAAGRDSAAQQPSRNSTIRATGKLVNSGVPTANTGLPETESIEGFTEPYADINLAASEMGTLTEVFVKDGDEVKVGQLLARLDDAVLQASLDVARSGMEAEGELHSAQTQLGLKEVELQKLTELFGRKHASQKELDRVMGEVQIAESRIQSVREELEVRRFEYARIEAQLKQQQILATIDGVVVDVRKDRGEFVSPFDPVVVRVVQLDPLLVVFSVPSERRRDVVNGQPVSMQIGSAKETAIGVVEYVSPTADPSSGTFRIKVRLPNSGRTWHGGEKSVLMLDVNEKTIVPAEQLANRIR